MDISVGFHRAMVGMCCLNFVPGGKGASSGLRAVFAVGGLGAIGAKTGKSIVKGAEKGALKGLVLNEGSKNMLKRDAFRPSKHFTESSHLSDIAGKTRAKNLKETVSNINANWRSAEFKGVRTGQSGASYHIFESDELRFVIDDKMGEIVTIYPF
jgi:hypothetical protein